MKVKVLRSDALSGATTKHKYNTKNALNITLKCRYLWIECCCCVMGFMQDQLISDIAYMKAYSSSVTLSQHHT